MLQKFFLIGTLLGLLALPANVRATNYLGMHIEVSGIASGNLYSAAPDITFFPNDPNSSNIRFTTGVISSADQQWKLTSYPTGWLYQPQPEFKSFAALPRLLHFFQDMRGQ